MMEALFETSYPIKGGDFARAGTASVEVKNVLKEVGYEPTVIRRVAVAAYEAEMNVVMYGGGGEMHIRIHPDHVYLVIEDSGPGIPDVDLALQEGYSTATDEMREMGFGAGMGLPNIRRNSDVFDIQTGVNEGTRLRLTFRIPGGAS